METKRRWSQPINWCKTQKQKKILTIAIFAGLNEKKSFSPGLENARISTVTSVLCRSVIPKMRPNECSDISTLSSVANLRVQPEFFLMVAQYQLRHKITCRIFNLKYAEKKRDGKRVSYCLHGNEPVYCWSYKLSSMTLIKTVIMTSLSSWRCKYFWRR